MKTNASPYTNKQKLVPLLTGAVLFGVSSFAMATETGTGFDVMAAATDAFAELSGQVDGFIPLAFGVLVTMVGATIGMKLLKKFMNKAT